MVSVVIVFKMASFYLKIIYFCTFNLFKIAPELIKKKLGCITCMQNNNGQTIRRSTHDLRFHFKPAKKS